MSYILEALRRAEAERERGRVPTLSSQPLAGGPVVAWRDAAAATRPGWPAVALGLGGLALLGLAGALLWPPAAAPGIAVPAAAVPPAVPPEPAASAAAALTPIATPAAAPAPLKTLPPPAFPPPAEPQAQAQAEAPPAQPVPLLAELPEALRRGLPPLLSGGALYSEQPAARMLILNGQLYREGDRVAEGLVLEQIQLKSAVLSLRGQRFSIRF